MGKLRFSKLIKFFAIALLGTATAIAAIAVMSSPVTAQAPGGGVVIRCSLGIRIICFILLERTTILLGLSGFRFTSMAAMRFALKHIGGLRGV